MTYKKKTYGHQLRPMTHFLTTPKFDLLLHSTEWSYRLIQTLFKSAKNFPNSFILKYYIVHFPRQTSLRYVGKISEKNSCPPLDQILDPLLEYIWMLKYFNQEQCTVKDTWLQQGAMNSCGIFRLYLTTPFHSLFVCFCFKWNQLILIMWMPATTNDVYIIY